MLRIWCLIQSLQSVGCCHQVGNEAPLFKIGFTIFINFIISIITLNILLVFSTYICAISFGLLLYRIKCLTSILLLIRSDGIYSRVLYNSCLVSFVFD